MGLKTNTVKKDISKKSLIENMSPLVGSSTSITQGDWVVQDSSTHLLRSATTGDLGGSCLGIAAQTIVNGKPVQPIQGTDVDASVGTPALEGPIYGITATFTLKTGDSLGLLAPVYLDGADGAQYVTATQPSSGIAVGIYQGPAISSAAAGTQVEVLVGQTLSAALAVF
jgi:hypothetical protein